MFGFNRKSKGAEVQSAVHAVVQIHAWGFSSEDPRTILDPRYSIPSTWAGSGFFIRVGGESGYILTNSHVVRNANQLQLMSLLTSGELFNVEIVGMVPTEEPDLALLKLPSDEVKRFEKLIGGEIPYLEFAAPEEISRGCKLKAIGYPFGMPEPNVSGGEITNFVSGDAHSPEHYVTDAAINPGNSGGPAVTEDGRVIGINTSIIINANNIGFITPIHYAEILVPELIRSKEAKLSDLGALIQPNSEPNAKYLGLESTNGVIVSHVIRGGILSNAGLQRMDVLLSVNGFEFDRYGNVVDPERTRQRTIFDIVRDIPSGESVSLVYLRAGKRVEASTAAVPRPEIGIRSQPLLQKRTFVEFQGMIIQGLRVEVIQALSNLLEIDFLSEVECRRSEKEALVVTHINPDSPADKVFLALGDIITKVRGEPMCKIEDFLTQIQAALAANEKEILIETQWGAFGVFSLEGQKLPEIQRAGRVPASL